MLQKILTDAEQKFSETIDHFTSELNVIRSGQSSPSLVEDLTVEAYGDKYTLKELAAISAPEPSLLLIQPWDQTVIQNIERAITTSSLGITPVVEGQNIRLSIPTLSEERREEFVKRVGQLTESAKIAVRNIRQDKMKSIDNLEDESLISEDERTRAEKEVQSLVEKFTAKIEDLRERKIAALMAD